MPAAAPPTQNKHIKKNLPGNGSYITHKVNTGEVFVDSWAPEVLACALKSSELDQRHLIEHFLRLNELQGLSICLNR